MPFRRFRLPSSTALPLSALPAIASMCLALVVGACGGSVPTTGASATATSLTPGTSAAPTVPPPSAAIATATITAPPVGTPPVTEPPATTAPVTEPPPTAAPPTAPPPTAAPGIGVKLQVGDQQFMTVVAAEQWPGAGTVKPKSGKAFFTVSIRIDAIKLTSFDSADFKLKDAAGHSYSWRSGRAPHLYSLDNMTAGGTYLGWITYEIPKASLGKVTLTYKPAFLGGTSFKVPLF